MPKYKFTSEIPLIFGFLSHGINATVTRAETEAKNLERDIEGSGVVLKFGDIVETSEKVVHAWLEEIDGKGKTVEKTVEEAPSEAPTETAPES